jgi:TonB-linked SusC/RagA family outer membrane protein
MTGTFRQCAALVFALAAVPAIANAQATITGRVIDRVTQQGIPSAQILIVGTQRGAVTGDEGQYQIRGVAAGQVTLRAVRIGYVAETRTITVPATGSVTADFALGVTAQQLDVVQVTASGQQQLKRESGANTGNINVAEDVPLPAVKSASQLLNGRVAGVTVQQGGGTTGAGSRIRIRGSNSVSLSNDPLVIVDGIRVNNNQASGTIDVGGQAISRFDDLNPEEIENIEVIKGPSAAALYGTAAANGVIQITTKRGRAGRTRWNAYGEYGSVKEVTQFPDNFAAVDICSQAEFTGGACFGAAVGDTIFGNLASTGGFGCGTDFVVQGFCNQDGIASFNPLEVNSPFQTGFTEKLGLNAAGGNENVTYFVGGDFQREAGVYSINQMRRVNGRANLRAQLRDNLDVTVNTGYLSSRTRLPQNDNNVRGIIPSGVFGYAFPNGGDGLGYGFFAKDDFFGIDTRQNVERFLGSLSGNWQPLAWLTSTTTFGLDFTNRHDHELIPPATSGVPTSTFADDPEGKRTSNPFQTFFYTFNSGLTANYGLTSTIRASTTGGVQYNNEIVRGTQAFGQRLLAGSGSLAGAATLFAVNETNTENVTIGGYLSQQIAWRDRLYLTAGARGDKNSAFGQDFGVIIYPAASLSWVVGEEGWFPRNNILSSLRLRTAYGESGQRPGLRDAIRFLAPTAVAVRDVSRPGADSDEPSFITGGVGLADLEPEKTREIEGGADFGFWGDRLALELTYYHKTTTDALILRRLPPSNGVFQTQFQNIGEVRNTGFEFLINGRVLDMRPVRFELTVNGSTTSNKIIDLGEGISAIAVTQDQDHRNGFPLGGYFGRKIRGWEDKNNDGIIQRIGCARLQANNTAACELTIDDEESYLGTPFPRREISVTPAITLFEYVRLSAMFDHKGGHKLLNFTEQFRCVAFQSCRASQDPNAPQELQARFAAGLLGTNAGYVEDATFTKLREVALTLSAPNRWASRVGVSGLSLTVAGRNLKTWTDYTGFDPEANEFGPAQFATDEFLTQPQTRFFTARLDVTW